MNDLLLKLKKTRNADDILYFRNQLKRKSLNLSLPSYKMEEDDKSDGSSQKSNVADTEIIILPIDPEATAKLERKRLMQVRMK